MAEISTVARPYAEAIFAQAQSEGSLEQWSQALAGLAGAATSPELLAVMGDPNLNDEQLFQLVVSGARDDLPAPAQNLVRVLIENNRIQALDAVREQFEALKHAHQGVVDAHIASAFPLDDAQKNALVADLETRFKRRVNAQVSVDTALIGGVLISIGDEVVDASVRGKLAAMTAELTRI
ncbi:MAG TPA: F0F1 ATP synthase subunit delta [Burkholderiales bacterium]|nr:F0F1 ATP synthase subunit delta [Burkholderiales bacterium]